MERYWVHDEYMTPSEHGNVVPYADAQATIAALQDTIMQMGGQAAVLAKDAMAAKEQVAALQAQSLKQAEEAAVVFAQLTQRTAELEAAKAIQAIDLKNNNEYREQVANLQAELERVRDQYEEMLAMVAALPKVEGEIAVIEVATDEWHVHDAIFTTQEQANNYANALRYRQGMEG